MRLGGTRAAFWALLLTAGVVPDFLRPRDLVFDDDSVEISPQFAGLRQRIPTALSTAWLKRGRGHFGASLRSGHPQFAQGVALVDVVVRVLRLPLSAVGVQHIKKGVGVICLAVEDGDGAGFVAQLAKHLTHQI